MNRPTVASTDTPLRVLVLCTRNSARSQMAEALFVSESGGLVVATSAGSEPGPGVHALAVEALSELGIDWRGRSSQGIDAVIGQPWDAVITVCDAARDACPFMPGARVSAHWGLEDPAAAIGEHDAQLQAFRVTRDCLRQAVRAFLSHVKSHPDTPLDDRLRDALAAGSEVLPLPFDSSRAQSTE